MHKFFHTIKARLSERGSLPAVMITAMLLSSTALLLASFSVINLKNSELLVAKSNIDKALTSCASILNGEVLRTFKEDALPTEALKTIALDKCNYSELGVQITVVGDTEHYTPPGASEVESLKVKLKAVYGENPIQPTKASTTAVRYLSFAEEQETDLTAASCIVGWTVDGHAIWASACSV